MSSDFAANAGAEVSRTAEIAARMDRLPPSWHVWRMVILLSLGGVFEFYDLFFTGYVAPGMVKSGLFSPASLGPLAAPNALAIAGVGIFVFATFAGLWVGALLWYMICSAIMPSRRPDSR